MFLRKYTFPKPVSGSNKFVYVNAAGSPLAGAEKLSALEVAERPDTLLQAIKKAERELERCRNRIKEVETFFSIPAHNTTPGIRTIYEKYLQEKRVLETALSQLRTTRQLEVKDDGTLSMRERDREMQTLEELRQVFGKFNSRKNLSAQRTAENTLKESKNEKDLANLMSESQAIQALTMTERLELQEQIMGLPEEGIEELVTVLKSEKKQSKAENVLKKNIETRINTLIALTENLKMGGKMLDKTILQVRETEERQARNRDAGLLLEQIDNL